MRRLRQFARRNVFASAVILNACCPWLTEVYYRKLGLMARRTVCTLFAVVFSPTHRHYLHPKQRLEQIPVVSTDAAGRSRRLAACELL